MKSFLIIALAIFCSLIFSAPIFGQGVIGGFNTSTQTGGTNNFGVSPLTPSTVATNATVGGLTRGTGVSTSGTGATRGMGGVGFNTTDAAASVAANKFFTFTVKANTGYTLSLSSINPFDYRRSTTGPANALIQYQINNDGFVDITTVAFPLTASTGGSAGPVSLSGISALQNLPDSTTVTFRFVPYGASASGGTFYFYDVGASLADDLAVNGTLNPASVVTPNLSINDVGVAEGNSGTTNFNFTVNLSSPAPTGGVTFSIATADNTATSASGDYLSKSLTNQVIPAGSSTYNFTVEVNGDTRFELGESFFVNVTDIVNAVAVDNQALGLIENDDAPPSFSIDDVSLAEGDSGSTNFVFTVTKTGLTELASSVTAATADGNANEGSDYTANSQILSFQPEETMKTFTVSVIGDTTIEPDETFFVNLTSSVAANITDSQGVGTIQNDDTAPAGVTISPTSVNVTEGGATAVYSVVLNSAPTANVTINAIPFMGEVTVTATSCSGNKNGKAQQNLGSVFALVFTPENYATPQCVLVTAIDDTDVEGDQTDYIDHTVSSADSNYNNLEIDFVEVNITDNETDTDPPLIIYSPLPVQNVEAFGPRITPNIFDDGSGLVGFGENRPRIYFRKNNGAWVSEPCNQDGSFFCDFDYHDFGGVVDGDIISYFIVAQDRSGNIGSNPGGITGTDVNNITIPDGFAPNAYAIGNVTVPTGNYTTINLNGGVLEGNVKVLSSMSFNGVIFVPNPFVLEIDCNVELSEGSESAYISGSLRKNFCSDDPSSFNFPVGTTVQTFSELGSPGGYSPVNITITNLGADPSSLTVSAVDAFLPGSNPSHSISRYWNVTETGDVTANLTFNYRNEDVPIGADETTFKVLRRETTTEVYSDETTVDEDANTGTASNVSNFSQWGIGNLAPTAAGVSVSGAVRAGSSPVIGATIMVTGGNLSQPIYTRTNNFGNYQFEGLSAGQTYVVTVLSNRYNFPQPSIILNVDDNVINANFEAEDR